MDGITAAWVEEAVGVPRFLDDLRAALKDGSAWESVSPAPAGLRLSEAKTRVVHMSEGFAFLGFRIQWKRKKGTSKHHVYTFIDQRPIRSLKAKIRALTRRTSQQDLQSVLTSLNQAMHGRANYFRHAVAKRTFSMLDNFAWWRVIHMLRARHTPAREAASG